jgi:hypothetical protein
MLQHFNLKKKKDPFLWTKPKDWIPWLVGTLIQKIFGRYEYSEWS